MRLVIVFAIAALVVAGLLPRYMDRIAGHAAAPPAPNTVQTVAPPPANTVQTVAPRPAYTGGPRTAEIPRSADGHFRVAAVVDGRRIGFVVDTGATLIALRKSEATRLGYHPTPRDYIIQAHTANGVVRVAGVKLGMVEVGGVMVRDVDATVHPDEALGQNLLGMSFLSRLRRFEYREGRLVLEE